MYESDQLQQEPNLFFFQNLVAAWFQVMLKQPAVFDKMVKEQQRYFIHSLRASHEWQGNIATITWKHPDIHTPLSEDAKVLRFTGTFHPHK